MPPDLSEARRPLPELPSPGHRDIRPTSPGTRDASTPSPCSRDTSPPHSLAPDSLNNDKRGEEQTPEAEGDGGQVQGLAPSRVGDEAGGISTMPTAGILASKRGIPPSASVNLYCLSPALRYAFSSVGATDTPYPFKEILVMLKNYLYSKRHLFDSANILYVNCGGDPLGEAFGVTRFHYNDVKFLIAKQLTRVHIPGLDSSLETTAKPNLQRQTNAQNSNLTVNTSNVQGITNLQNTEAGARLVERRSDVSGPFAGVEDRRLTNDRTPLSTQYSCEVSSSTTCMEHLSRGCKEQEAAATATTTQPTYIVAGSSRCGQQGRGERQHWAGTISIQVPDIPDSTSDVESIYSCQGYETAFCRNTEFEESEGEAEDDSDLFEEYEIADDEDEQELNHSDDDDSVIEDVSVALLAIHALVESDDEDFWADDSESEGQSTDEDPELRAERWDCLTCGLKNKPFVRYCGKCWQLRKNWLPDRPKRRRRKPRPKKKAQRPRADSIMSDDQNSCVELAALVKSSSTTSTATTVSFRSNSPVPNSSDIYSSQDSGICMSTENMTEGSQEFSMEKAESSGNSVEETTSEPSTSGAQPCSSKRKDVLSSIKEYDLSESLKGQLRKKRKLSSSEQSQSSNELSDEAEALEVTLRKKQKLSSSRDSQSSSEVSDETEEQDARSEKKYNSTSSDEESLPKGSKEEPSSEEGEEEDEDVAEAKSKQFLEFLQSSSGKEWLKSRDSQQFLSSPQVKEVLMEAIVANMCNSPTADLQETPSGLSIMCSICYLRPKNASIIHGRLSHQATCYQCARRLLDSGQKCPVCRRKIHMVCKHIIA